jgi:hypothetical protein
MSHSRLFVIEARVASLNHWGPLTVLKSQPVNTNQVNNDEERSKFEQRTY